MENTRKSPEYILRYMKKRYDNDEDYKDKQKEKALKRYNENREYLIDKYANDEDYRKKRAEICHRYYLKKKAEREAKKEEERKAKEEAKLRELEVHIDDNL